MFAKLVVDQRWVLELWSALCASNLLVYKIMHTFATVRIALFCKNQSQRWVLELWSALYMPLRIWFATVCLGCVFVPLFCLYVIYLLLCYVNGLCVYLQQFTWVVCVFHYSAAYLKLGQTCDWSHSSKERQTSDKSDRRARSSKYFSFISAVNMFSPLLSLHL